MSDRRNLIRDVIYGLKMEYGERVTVNRDTVVENLDTATRTPTVESVVIPKAIPLPVNLRLQFLKSLNIQKVAASEEGTSEVLFEIADFRGSDILKAGSYILDSRNRRRVIKTVQNYDDAAIAIVKDSV